MKKRLLKLFVILQVVAMLGIASGCGSNPKDGNLESNTDKNMTGDTTSSEVKDSVESSVDSAENDDVTNEDEVIEEPYLLRFVAKTVEGEEFTSDCFSESKLTMINVWATYCNPCLSEMPDLGEIATAYDKGDFQLIGIISDVMDSASQSDIDYAKQLIEDTKATTYPHLLLGEDLYMNLVGGVSAVPTTFFVNQKGEMLGYLMGAQSKESWMGLIEQLLAEVNQANQ